MDSSHESVSIVSTCSVIPHSRSSMESLKLSVPDLSMLSCGYIQKGCLFSGNPSAGDDSSLVSILKLSLSKTLSLFPPLAGCLSTDSITGHISVACSDAGALFIHARASSLLVSDLLDPHSTILFHRFFDLSDTLNYEGHTKPLAAVQVTVLADGVFIGISVNHAVADGASLWNFLHAFSEISRGETKISRPPCFSRDNAHKFLFTDVDLRFPGGRPEETFPSNDLIILKERIFHFSGKNVNEIKKIANETLMKGIIISSFQALCAYLWKYITRARNLAPTETTSFYMAVNFRQRVNPKMDPLYFGNAFQVIKTASLAGELVSRELGWSADLLRRNVVAHDDRKVRDRVEEWVRDSPGVPVAKSDGSTVMVGGSPRFEMYDIDFGWGPPVAVRSGKMSSIDGMLTVYPGPEGHGSVEFKVVLPPETMLRLEEDTEFMKYVN